MSDRYVPTKHPSSNPPPLDDCRPAEDDQGDQRAILTELLAIVLVGARRVDGGAR